MPEGKAKVGIYVPKELKEKIDKLCEARKRNLSNLFEVVFEAEIERAIAAGELAEIDSSASKEIKTPRDLDDLLTMLADGKMPTDTDITLAAQYTHISVDELKALCVRIRKENGHAAAR